MGPVHRRVHRSAPSNPHRKGGNLVEREMVVDWRKLSDARRAFLHLARGAVVDEHSQDAFETWILGRGLARPLEHPVDGPAL